MSTLQIDEDRLYKSLVEELILDGSVEQAMMERVSAEVEVRVDKLFKDKVNAVIDDLILQITVDGFNREYTVTNAFGQEKETSTIAKQLEKRAADYWSEQLDASGRPASGYSAKYTRAEYLMTQICAEDFSKAVKSQAVGVVAQFKDGLRDQLQSSVNTMLDDLFKVRTYGDQQAGKKRG